jgi:hypothetical protein
MAEEGAIPGGAMERYAKPAMVLVLIASAAVLVFVGPCGTGVPSATKG